MSRIAEDIEIPFSPVAKPKDLYDDPQLNAGGRMLTVDLKDNITSKVPRLPVEVGDHDFGLRLQPPKVGEHSREILADIGLSDDEISDLAKQSVVVAGS
jgi:crotonobetainyl-CoA:carnitine CoA-transferase CaiB-like acyl-CoA transferase